MIELIQRLCRLFATESVTIHQTAARIGTITSDQETDRPIEVQPADPTVREALVVPLPDVSEPDYAELVPADSPSVTVSALVAAFGPYRRVPKLHWRSPSRIIFYPGIHGPRHTCAVIAEVDPGERGIDDGTVTRVTVRRDVRLDQ